MYYYHIYGLDVASDYNFKQLFSISEPSNTDITIKQVDNKEVFADLSDTSQIPDKYCHQSNYTNECISFFYPCQGTFKIYGGNTIEFYLRPDYDIVFAEQFMLCFAFGCLLRMRHTIALHGSGIVLNNKLVSISGASGSGKSSLADGLLKAGGLFLADDTIALSDSNPILGYPTMPFRKLCDNHFTDQEKMRLTPLASTEREKYALLLDESEFFYTPTPLAAMFVIEVANIPAPTLTEITGANKLKYITDNLYQRPVYDKLGIDKLSMLKCISLASKIPVYVITRPEGRMTVDEQAALVFSML